MSRPAIRYVRAEDLDELFLLYGHLHERDDSLPDSETIGRVWSEIAATRGMHILVADLDGMLVASCVLSVIPNLTRACRPYGLVENVVTHADYRRRGFGRLVIEEALDIAWSSGCYKVMLLTGRRDERTHRFYESCGFVAGEKTGYVARPN